MSLVRSHHRAVLRNLKPHLEDGQEPSCLHPGLVWEAARTSTAVDTGRIADLIRSLDTAGLMPPIEHLALDAPMCPDWCRWGIRQLLTDIQRTRGTDDTEFSAPHMKEGIAHLEDARETLRRVWPEAALEMDLLIRAIVYVQGGAFRSGTLRQTFGAIYLGTASVESTPAAFEALLHETGHHALYLRNHFETFVTNGDAMVSHALRPDPRPVAGAVHAAHVLARMTYGLARWAGEPAAPPEVSERRDQALRRLKETIAALEPVAEWTERGRLYFDDLLKWEQELTGTHPS
ncbi:HEXXH motif-containing putative peptide modification protein [Streptomyces sp. NPDC059991]|uniref:aKG-HExxH-type peptide beta-hydroxylase n=1 Tax=Streptomyces sp. NPDC059991 TaxID=3347028 RepID=UPI0036A73971